MDQRLLAPVNTSEIEVRIDETNFIANPSCDQRGLGIVENDALLLIVPARRFVDFGDDRVEAEMRDAISKYAFLRVKRFSLPREIVDELRYLIAEPRAVSYDCGAFSFATRDLVDGAVREKLVELSVSHVE